MSANRQSLAAIRPAATADIARMHELRLAVRENRLARPGSIALDDYAPFVDAGDAWIAEDGRAILGFAALDAGGGSVWALFVAPDAQGQGVGDALHDTLVEAAAARGLVRLRLTTEAGTRAERFYMYRGWQAEGRSPGGEIAMSLVVPQAGEPR